MCLPNETERDWKGRIFSTAFASFSIYPFSIRVTINRGKPVEDKGGKMSQISEAQEKEALNTELIEEPE